MTERPIIFSGPMVRAIRDGRKTQTRRVLKEPPWATLGTLDVVDGDPWAVDPVQGGDRPLVWPYLPRDILWVRETFYHADASSPGGEQLYYRADEPQYTPPRLRWRPSIHMPRWAARLFLRVTDVRVERLQEISADDIRAEGINEGAAWPVAVGSWQTYADDRPLFRELWDSLNAKRGYGWDVNPWVWVVSFDVLTSEGTSDEHR